jgi:hypothetical protein
MLLGSLHVALHAFITNNLGNSHRVVDHRSNVTSSSSGLFVSHGLKNVSPLLKIQVKSQWVRAQDHWSQFRHFTLPKVRSSFTGPRLKTIIHIPKVSGSRLQIPFLRSPVPGPMILIPCPRWMLKIQLFITKRMHQKCYTMCMGIS